MEKIKHIFISCGEASGDLHAANLIRSIKNINPGIRFSGVGGQLMRQAGAEIFHDIKDLSVIGFFDVLKKLPLFFSLKDSMLKKIDEERPDAIIFVDFSGFNLRLAKSINKTIPCIYYISPQVWASRKGRVKLIRKYIDKLIVLFKFEEEFYKKFGVRTDFVGHPLLDIVKPKMERKEFITKFGLSESKTTVALLPGSRRKEVENILPVILKSCLIISREIGNIQFIIAKSTQVGWDAYNHLLKGAAELDVKVIEDETYDCLNAASFCLVASGTATLETAIMQKPFLLIYKMSALNYLLYRPQVKIPYIGIVNIVAGQRIVPEFIQEKATAQNIAGQAIKTLSNPAGMQDMIKSLRHIKSMLGEKGASGRAARIIVDFLESRRP